MSDPLERCRASGLPDKPDHTGLLTFSAHTSRCRLSGNPCRHVCRPRRHGAGQASPYAVGAISALEREYSRSADHLMPEAYVGQDAVEPAWQRPGSGAE